MKRIWTIIGVADVPGSFRWYQSLLGLQQTAPVHNYFGQIVGPGWNGPALSPRMVRPRASLFDKSPPCQAWQRPPLVLSRRQL